MAAGQGVARQAFHLLALEDVVVDGGLLRRGRDRLLLLGVPDHEIGIGADEDGPLLRVAVQDLGDVGAGHGHELVRRQAPGVHAMRPEHRHPVLEPPRPVRDLGEVADPEALLLGGEGAMVGGHDREAPALQPGPEAVLVLLVAEGRRHHPPGGMVPIGVAVFAVVQGQVLDQGFTPDALALLAGTADGLMRLLARGMDDVEGHARHVGDHDGAVGGLALHLRRPGIGMGLGARVALGQEAGRQLRHHVAVLGMDHGEAAEVAHPAEGLEHLVVIDHQGALVGHEVLERGHAGLDRSLHVLPDLLAPPGDGHVVGVVARGAPRLVVPHGGGIHQPLALAGEDKVHDHGRPA